VPALGFWDLLIIAFVLLLIFGPKRLPQMGKSIGGGIKEFKDSVTGHVDKQDAEAEAEAKAAQAPAQLPPAQPAPPQQQQPQAQPDPRERDTVL
jgi:sec-independent protein translocase protein TatA